MVLVGYKVGFISDVGGFLNPLAHLLIRVLTCLL